MNLIRHDGRTSNQVRPLLIQYDVYGHADASVIFEQGGTKVLVSVSLQPGVPHFLKGKRTGWLSAEYAMLPHATHQRTTRESTQAQRNARSVEISRLIGRCLRSTIDLSSLGERSIFIDCDVLQADGGTRVACLTAASLALKLACARWIEFGIVEKNIFKVQLAALSVGIVNNNAYADLSYHEDSQADADFNFVLTEHDELVEIQGTSEKAPMAWQFFDQLRTLSVNGVREVFKQMTNFPLPLPQTNTSTQQKSSTNVYPSTVQINQEQKKAFFSLGQRLHK